MRFAVALVSDPDLLVLDEPSSIVADGPTTEIKAMVGLRTIRATLPGADRARHRDRGGRARAGVRATHGGRRGVITYAKYEIVRTFRNRRFFIFSIGFPAGALST